MIKISVRSNVAQVVADMGLMSTRDMPFAIAKSLTLTMKSAQAAEIEEMKRVFDRPTPYALNGTYVQTASKTNLTASIKFKDEAFKGTPAVKFLGPETEGGERNHKRFENALIARGLMPSGMFAVPGERAPLDRYGNLSGPFVEQLLSALGASETYAGHTSDRTARSTKRNPNKVRADYFVGRPGNGHGPLGIWQRIGNGARPIVIFVRAPQYKPRDDFYGVAERVVAAEFDQRLAQTFEELIGADP